ncbi:MAG: sigma-54 interaction domain-containing protein [Myxococcota bacterium]|nr:sigma-54 dependent transcriptional regulator [Myxococcota bacterium]
MSATLSRESVAVMIVANNVDRSLIGNLVSMGQRRHPVVPVVVLGTTATVEEAVEVMQQGAADFVPAPAQAGVLSLRLRRVLERPSGESPKPPGTPAPEYLGLIGSSPMLRALYTAIEKVSRFKTNVLLLGESGTGKELIARVLHARGPRRNHLFVPINCATLGRDLLENELFGHERGAFTGANERKKGLFELADGGTLFLDEIAEMDLATQAKLLRVLERNAFRRVGGSDKVKVDLSVIAATNRNLHEAIAAGRFREDLYYRLKVVTLVIPPLRERREDIPSLIEHFIADFNRRNDQKIKGIAPAALKLLMEHDWPGNVRELKNAIESAAVLSSSETLGLETIDGLADAGALRRSGETPPGELRIAVGTPLPEIEKVVIQHYVDRYATKAEAARALGMGLRTLYTKLEQYEREERKARLPKPHVVVLK